jgi:hypothetical protein
MTLIQVKLVRLLVLLLNATLSKCTIYKNLPMTKNLNKDAAYRAARSIENDYILSDGVGLQLLVKSNGSKLWELRYTFDGKLSLWNKLDVKLTMHGQGF